MLKFRRFKSGILYQSDVMAATALVAPGSVDLVLVDPPYSSGGMTASARKAAPEKKYQGSGTKKTYPTFDGDTRDQRSYLAWCALWGAASLRVLKPGGVHAQFTDWRQLPVTTDAVQVAGLTWRGIVPWDKTEAVRPQLASYRQQAEYIVWADRGRGSKRKGVAVLPGAYRYRILPSEKQHMCGKPVALLRDLIQITPAGGLVADWFMGSGSTAVAAIQTGRRFVGCEMSAEYFDIAARRIEEAEKIGIISP